MSKAGKIAPFPLLLPFRQQLATSFSVDDGTLTVAAARASVRLHADPHVIEQLTNRSHTAIKLSVRAVGRVEDLSAHFRWDLASKQRPGRPPVLELALLKYSFATKGPRVVASADYKLYRACVDGDCLA